MLSGLIGPENREVKACGRESSDESPQHSGSRWGAWTGRSGVQEALSQPRGRGSVQTLARGRATTAQSDRKQCREDHINGSDREDKRTHWKPVNNRGKARPPDSTKREFGNEQARWMWEPGQEDGDQGALYRPER